MAKLFCEEILSIYETTGGYMQFADQPESSLTFYYGGKNRIGTCVNPFYEDSNGVLSYQDLKLSCGNMSSGATVSPTPLTIDDIADGEVGFLDRGQWLIYSCSAPEFSSASYTSSTTEPINQAMPSPTEIIEAFGTGFFLFMPVFLAIYGGRLLLKTVLSR